MPSPSPARRSVAGHVSPKSASSQSSTKYLTAADVCRQWRISRVTLWRWSRQGFAPRPVRFAAGTVRWAAEEIEEFEQRLAGDRTAEQRGGLHVVSSREVVS